MTKIHTLHIHDDDYNEEKYDLVKSIAPIDFSFYDGGKERR